MQQLFCLLVKNAHCSIKNRRIVQRNQAAVGTLLEVNAHCTLGIEVTTAEIVADSLNIYTQFISYAL